MRFCQPHWDTMRAAVDERGMAALVPDDGARAAEVLARSLEGEESLDTFDPLMWMHMAIWSRAMSFLSTVGADPMLLMVDWAQVPEVGADDPAFVEAAACPLCLLDMLAWEHDVGCTDQACQKEPGPIVADWIPSCADDALERYKHLLAAS